MTKEELATERNEVREILECFSEELSQANLDKISRVFSIINGDEKRIAELEATCNKWFEHLKNREEELLNELNNQNAKYNKQIAELEKENAELKGLKDVATLIRANNDTVITLMQLNNKLVSKSQQLTKAKEIIRQLLLLPYANNEEVYADVTSTLNKAEQFLSEVEK